MRRKQADMIAEWRERRCEMIAMREAGKTLQEIANVFHITRERVRQQTKGVIPSSVCPVCDTRFESTFAKKYCSHACSHRVNEFGLKRARELFALYRFKQAQRNAGLKRCYGACHEWLPTERFSPTSRTCKQCTNEQHKRRYHRMRRQKDTSA